MLMVILWYWMLPLLACLWAFPLAAQDTTVFEPPIYEPPPPRMTIADELYYVEVSNYFWLETPFKARMVGYRDSLQVIRWIDVRARPLSWEEREQRRYAHRWIQRVERPLSPHRMPTRELLNSDTAVFYYLQQQHHQRVDTTLHGELAFYPPTRFDEHYCSVDSRYLYRDSTLLNQWTVVFQRWALFDSTLCSIQYIYNPITDQATAYEGPTGFPTKYTTAVLLGESGFKDVINAIRLDPRVGDYAEVAGDRWENPTVVFRSVPAPCRLPAMEESGHWVSIGRGCRLCTTQHTVKNYLAKGALLPGTTPAERFRSVTWSEAILGISGDVHSGYLSQRLAKALKAATNKRQRRQLLQQHCLEVAVHPEATYVAQGPFVRVSEEYGYLDVFHATPVSFALDDYSSRLYRTRVYWVSGTLYSLTVYFEQDYKTRYIPYSVVKKRLNLQLRSVANGLEFPAHPYVAYRKSRMRGRTGQAWFRQWKRHMREQYW